MRIGRIYNGSIHIQDAGNASTEEILFEVRAARSGKTAPDLIIVDERKQVILSDEFLKAFGINENLEKHRMLENRRGV
ncbi:MAG: hypothetical protein WAX22_02795 [Lactococcus hircilactis]|uniref:hypothetical protein n=1 Tax=Lactococcus hircilactis TaxID=1494462 RepID=UPI003BB9E6FF